MKIRTRLLLSLLPAIAFGIVLIGAILFSNSRTEFSSKLDTALASSATLLENDASQEKLIALWQPFEACRLSKIDETGIQTLLLATASQESANHWITASLDTPHARLIAEVQTTAVIQPIHFAIGGVCLLVLIAIGSLYFIAGKIAEPIQKLNNSALAIAAGQYGESIQVAGFKELSELSNTLNTMSECLLENINRLKENSFLRERMVGEAECARLLQHLMLQKNIDECSSDAIAVKAITFSSTAPRGLLLDFPRADRSGHVNVHLAEAIEEGFEGMYQLLTHYKLSKEHPQEDLPFSSLSLTLNRDNSTLFAKSIGCAQPYLWSVSSGELQELVGKRPVEAGDFVFLMNQGFFSFFKEPTRVSDLLSRVLKYFSQDGLETCAAMLQKEIAFATKRKELEADIHLLCIQILKPEL